MRACEQCKKPSKQLNKWLYDKKSLWQCDRCFGITGVKNLTKKKKKGKKIKNKKNRG